MIKVLIVEDELIPVFLLSKYLEKQKYTIVDTVSNGTDAIEAVKKYNPDIILMDINIQEEIDGVETMEQIRLFSAVPVIYITSFADPDTKERIKFTMNACLKVKPINNQELTHTIVDMLASDYNKSIL